VVGSIPIGSIPKNQHFAGKNEFNAPRCKGSGCHRIIRVVDLEQLAIDPSLKKNIRGKYRTRKAKKLCSRNCKNKWRYHYVLKPRRQR